VFLASQHQYDLRLAPIAFRPGRVVGGLLAVLLTVGPGCHKSPTDPGGGGGGGSTPPAIVCPANIVVESSSSGVVVNYPPPTTSGGTPPLTTTCDVPSGSALPVGTQKVTCTTRDTGGQSASCSFTITVQPIPMLKASQFVAYGDSVTNGETAPGQTPSYKNVDQAYPAVLQSLLRARYKAQTIMVFAVGIDGQTAAQGRQLLASAIAQYHPDVLLLLEGVNDLNQGETPAHVAAYLADDVRIAKNAGVQTVFLSTILPQTPCPPTTTSPCRSSPESQQAIVDTNVLLRNVAPVVGAVLVDNYAALAAAPTMYIGDDGLHPTEDGHHKIAETFFESIKTNLEVPAAAVLLRVKR
jgi:lysophospholipase L1-like esterase